LVNDKGKTIATFNTGADKIYLVNDIIWNNHDNSLLSADFNVGFGRILPNLRPQGSALFNPKIDDITDDLTVQVAIVFGKTYIGSNIDFSGHEFTRNSSGDRDITSFIKISTGEVR